MLLTYFTHKEDSLGLRGLEILQALKAETVVFSSPDDRLKYGLCLFTLPTEQISCPGNFATLSWTRLEGRTPRWGGCAFGYIGLLPVNHVYSLDGFRGSVIQAARQWEVYLTTYKNGNLQAPWGQMPKDEKRNLTVTNWLECLKLHLVDVNWELTSKLHQRQEKPPHNRGHYQFATW